MKTIPFTAAHTYIAHIRQYPPSPTPGFPLSVWPSGVDYFSEFMGTVSVSNFETKVSQSHKVSNLPFYTPLKEQPSKNELAGSQYFC